SKLHQAINEIRDLRSQIQNLHKRFGDDQRLKPALSAADDLDHKMSEVEQKLIQVNMKGSEANLAFPDMLNERFDTFSHVIEYSDKEPTKPQLDVFQMLSSQLDDQLKKWAQPKNEKAVILAAGRGTRMRELTNDLPKPMLEVRGKPVLQHIIEGLRDAGVRKLLIIVGYHADAVQNFFGDGSRYNVDIQYVTQV